VNQYFVIYLELVQNLKVHSIQIANGNILQKILERVESSNQGEFPAIASENGIVDLLEKDCGGGSGGECL
jgi:hypothetical protein